MDTVCLLLYRDMLELMEFPLMQLRCLLCVKTQWVDKRSSDFAKFRISNEKVTTILRLLIKLIGWSMTLVLNIFFFSQSIFPVSNATYILQAMLQLA